MIASTDWEGLLYLFAIVAFFELIDVIRRKK